MKIIDGLKLSFGDVLIRPRKSTINSRKDVCLTKFIKPKWSNKQLAFTPIIAANMDTVGTFQMAKELHKHNIITAIHKHYTLEEWGGFISSLEPDSTLLNNICVSSGTSDNDFNKLASILDKYSKVNMICLDIANGYSSHFVDFIKKTRQNFPSKVIIAGNVVTGEMTEELLEAGADIIKVGIGGGSVCTTRLKAGVGYPQLSAVMECAEVAHKLGGHIISDGGCVCPGDISKALGAGADLVMLGGMFSGHEESGGEVIEVDGKKFKSFYGMSSKTAMTKHTGEVKNYRSSEGKHVLIPYKGLVKNTCLDILGGVRSTCTYVGALNINELFEKTIFIRTNIQTNNIYNNLHHK